MALDGFAYAGREQVADFGEPVEGGQLGGIQAGPALAILGAQPALLKFTPVEIIKGCVAPALGVRQDQMSEPRVGIAAQHQPPTAQCRQIGCGV